MSFPCFFTKILFEFDHRVTIWIEAYSKDRIRNNLIIVISNDRVNNGMVTVEDKSSWWLQSSSLY